MTDEEDTRLKTSRRAESPREMRLVAFWEGGSASWDLTLGSRVTIGRAEECDLRIPDDSVSRRHAAVSAGPPAAIEDLGSANGTFLGGARLSPEQIVPLAPGAVVEMGDALLVLRAVTSNEGREPAPSLAPKAIDGDVVDPAMKAVYDVVELVASTTIPVLVLGETGAGKGLIAERIHRRSPRKDGPFVRLNCAALAETLLESELFGHERGAFTGATQAKPGLMEAASGGVVLLDEIGDMPLATQAKVLHTLEHGEVLRVGAVRPRPIDVRFVAATNRDLQTLVAEGRFREDLFFRLNGVTIEVPPLRDRPTEIVSLARAFAAEASARMGRPAAFVSDEAIDALLAYAWPGNVRELRNVMLRATLFAQSGRVGPEHLSLTTSGSGVASRPSIRPDPRGVTRPPEAHPLVAPEVAVPDARALRDQVRELEKRRIVEALERAGKNQVETAKALGISRGTLRSRMKELGLLPSRDKK